MARRNEDPKKTKARERRAAAETHAAVIAKGIGAMLAEDARWSDNLRQLIAIVNLDLATAVAELKAAEKAYEPYWSRRRHRIRVVPKKNRKTKAA